MKVFKATALLFGLLLSNFGAQASGHKVVFEITSEDQKMWETLLHNVENVRKELGPKTEMEVVTHGAGIKLFLKKSNFQMERMKKLSSEGVKLLGCENTMKRKDIVAKDLYPFVGTVPAGLAEVIRKQTEGWAYIKISH